MQLTDIPKILDEMVSKQKEKRAKTFVARYKGKNLIMRSGKSSWKQVNHAKSAVIRHFYLEEKNFAYDGWVMGESSWKETLQRKEEFRAELFKLIEIVELTD